MGDQPDVNAVIRSQQFYRLKQVVESPGAIYEIDESALSIYIGPDSDISEVEVTYFNPDEPLGLETATVSVNGPFVGRLDALLKTQVPSTGQPARILVSPSDLVDNAYTPPASYAFGGAASRKFNIPAVVDVIFGLKPQPEIPQVRADRTIRFPNVVYGPAAVGPPNGSTNLIVPIYGRRMVTLDVIGNQLDCQVSLVTLEPGPTTTPRFVTDVGLGVSTNKQVGVVVFRASDAARHGNIYNPAGTVIANVYQESDGPAVPTTTLPRGMADLMLINISDTSGNPGAKFADVFLRLCDRET